MYPRLRVIQLFIILKALNQILKRKGAFFSPYAFAVKCSIPRTYLCNSFLHQQPGWGEPVNPESAPAPASVPIALPFDLAVARPDGTSGGAAFDAAGRSLAAELLPGEVDFGGVKFVLGPAAGANALSAKGQSIALPEGKFTRLYLLAAADGDRKAVFKIDGKPVELTVQDWGGYIGQWDNRKWNVREEPVPAKPQPAAPGSKPQAGASPAAKPQAPRMRTVMEYAGLMPGFTKPAPVAWFASHRHLADGTNDLYMYSYLFAYALDLPAGARTLVLPDDAKVKILAATLTDDPWPVKPVQPLFDTLERGPAGKAK